MLTQAENGVLTGFGGSMFLVIVGCLLVALKLAEVGPIAAWSWWLVAAPLLVAIAWWRYADASGLNKRREIAKMEERKAKRRSAALETIGIGPKAEQEKREAEKALAARQRQIEKVEGKRAASRAKARDSVLGSRYDTQQLASTFNEARRP
jgi:small Trp-rich protein